MVSVETKPGLRELTTEMLRPAIGRIFRFKRPTGQDSISGAYVELKLVEVKSFEHRCHRGTELSGNGSGHFREPFSLLFELVEGMQPLGPGLHRLEHSDFLPEDWHVARVQVFGRDPGKAYYEAVFG